MKETTAQFILRLEEVNRRKAAIIKALEATLKNPVKEKAASDK